MKLYTFFIALLTSLIVQAQTQYDYYDDGKVDGGVNTVFNGVLWMIIIVVVLVVLLFVASGILNIYYWFNPESRPEFHAKQKKIEKEKSQINSKQKEPIICLKTQKEQEKSKITRTHRIILSITGKTVEVKSYEMDYKKNVYVAGVAYKSISKVEANKKDITDTVFASPFDDAKASDFLLNPLEVIKDSCSKLETKHYEVVLEDELDYSRIYLLNISFLDRRSKRIVDLYSTYKICYNGKTYPLKEILKDSEMV